ncbi:MAG: hypothetical protein ABIN89_29595 [Chitinophagaceae bacterium]
MLNKKNWLILLLLPFFAFDCHKKEEKCIHAKVIRVSCASFVVQVLNKDSVGSYGWKDVGGHGIYNNVLNISNSCKIGKFARGEELYFTIQDTLRANDCIVCKMYDAPPEKSYIVENVTRKKCE